MADDINFIDNSRQATDAMNQAVKRGLEACGMKAETYAKRDTPVDTGRLKNSITHKVVGNDCYIGTNVKYAIWQEIGTGIYASEGGGRSTPWAYEDDKGEVHVTRGTHAHHMLKNAASQHAAEYKEIMKNAGGK